MHPGQFAPAARIAGVSPKTAEKAWRRGWPGQGLAPIETIIAEEQRAARALIEQQRKAALAKEQLEKENARKDAELALQQEGQMVRLGRAATLQLTANTAVLAQQVGKMREALEQRFALELQKMQLWTEYEASLLTPNPKPKPVLDKPALHLDHLLHLLNRTGDYTGKVLDNARKVMEMERLILGEPTNIIGLANASSQASREISLEEADIRREAANRAIDGAKAAGGLTVIPGGKVLPRVGQRFVPR